MTIYHAEKIATKVLDLVWDGTFPVDPIAIAAQLKKKVPNTDIKLTIAMQGASNDSLNGASGMAELKLNNGEPSEFVCTYNQDESLVRQRFTQAHELGHVILNHVKEDQPCMRDVCFENSSPNERAANAFAAELLMPAQWLPKMFREQKSPTELAKILGVSVTALHYRLKNLRLI